MASEVGWLSQVLLLLRCYDFTYTRHATWCRYARVREWERRQHRLQSHVVVVVLVLVVALDLQRLLGSPRVQVTGRLVPMIALLQGGVLYVLPDERCALIMNHE